MDGFNFFIIYFYLINIFNQKHFLDFLKMKHYELTRRFFNFKISVDQFNRLAKDLMESRIRAQKRILIGPHGGKSTFLRQAVRLCSNSGWIVFHINCEDLICDEKSLEAVGKKILERQLELNPLLFKTMKLPYKLYDVTFEQFIQNGIQENRCAKTLHELIVELSLFDDSRVLFAFERWDSLFNNEQNSVAQDISHWFTFDVTNGFALYCTTKSFDLTRNEIGKYFPGYSACERVNFIKFL